MIDAKRAADKVWAKIMRSGAPRIVFVSLAHGGRVLTLRAGSQFMPPAGRVVGVYDRRADPDALESDIRELLQRLGLAPSNLE